MEIFKYKCRINNLELRSCNEHLLQDGKHCCLEIVQWQQCSEDCENECCLTIAYWKPCNTDLTYVDTRPLNKDVNQNIFNMFVEMGCKLMDSISFIQ